MLCLVVRDEMQVWAGMKPHCNVIMPQYSAFADEEFVLHACPVQVEYTLKVPPLNPDEPLHVFHASSPAEQSLFSHPPARRVLDLNDSTPSSRGSTALAGPSSIVADSDSQHTIHDSIHRMTTRSQSRHCVEKGQLIWDGSRWISA